jgi:hypothetical protein
MYILEVEILIKSFFTPHQLAIRRERNWSRSLAHAKKCEFSKL